MKELRKMCCSISIIWPSRYIRVWMMHVSGRMNGDEVLMLVHYLIFLLMTYSAHAVLEFISQDPHLVVQIVGSFIDRDLDREVQTSRIGESKPPTSNSNKYNIDHSGYSISILITVQERRSISRSLMPQATGPAPPPISIPRQTPICTASMPIQNTMDIDDILASVDRGAGASPESTALDHQQLTRFWVAERAVSEVLPWPAPLMERVMDRVRLQVCDTLYLIYASLG
jgi:Uncharacterized conserved protein